MFKNKINHDRPWQNIYAIRSNVLRLFLPSLKCEKLEKWSNIAVNEYPAWHKTGKRTASGIRWKIGSVTFSDWIEFSSKE